MNRLQKAITLKSIIVNMRKTVTVALTVCLAFAWVPGNSQQPVLSVENFEYIWDKNPYEVSLGKNHRVIIPSADSLNDKIKKSFARAIQRRWNIKMPEVSLSVKPLGILSYHPKFNTKLKDKQPDIWYMFLQIFDKGNLSYLYHSNDDILATTLELKCRVISSASDSPILDRALTVELYTQPPPLTQVTLTRLPAYPAYFVQAFDSIAAWLFQPEAVSQKSLWLKPACVFIETKPGDEPVTQLIFKSDNENIYHVTQPLFSFHLPLPKYERTNAKRNTVGNTATGAITLFTGVHINKERVFEYRADFPFEMNDSTYHCFINYAEAETAEREREKVENSDGSKSYSVQSGSYRMNERRTDSTFLNAITLGSDTLATFRITYITNAKEHSGYTRFWDGSDSATIITLPREWNNTKEEDNVIIYGKTGDNSFLMKTTKETTAKEFYINDRLVMIVYGKNAPAKALLFQPVSALQLKLFTILCLLPYPYFNYTAN